MNFFDLPIEIITLIYTYDCTYKELYNYVIKDIYELPTYQSYDSEFKSYLFSITPYKGIYIYSVAVDSDKYKNAFKKAVKKAIKKSKKKQ